MGLLAEDGAAVSPVLVAALLLAGRDHLRRLELPCAGVEDIVLATGASRSRAYELRDTVLEALPALLRPVGRPPAPSSATETSDVAASLSRAVGYFVMDHPGCVYGGAERRRYDDAFRHFIIDLYARHADFGVDAFARAALVPVGTLKDWLGAGNPPGESATDTTAAAPPTSDQEERPSASGSATSTQIETVLSAWKTWSGSFIGFCDHVQQQWRIPFGRTLVGEILEMHGERRPRRRAGRSPDEQALRDSFETFFPGAQWVGDGSPIVVTVGRERFRFNLELMVDASSGGFVGVSFRDEEDSAAVVECLGDGVETTGAAPLCVLLDNRPSNHTSEVDEALGDATLRMRATTARPQNKAHCEGAFGLFQQMVPPLEVTAGSLREVARQILVLVTQTWARTLNHRPRCDRGGHSRVELHGEQPTAEQIAQARADLEERCRKQELARETMSARQDPDVRALLDEAFERLALLDPERHIRVAIARYPIDVVVDGIAIFEAKRSAKTLPEGVDARYLLGIVRNIGDEREGIAIAEALLRARLHARDRLLAPLVYARDAARASAAAAGELVLRFVDHALAAERRLDRFFWLISAADIISLGPNVYAAPLVRAAARRIHATHSVSYRERLDAARFLVAKVAPLD
jgi:hypothetical protein